ncbi:chaperonin 10-like protein [Aspergillus californicus]
MAPKSMKAAICRQVGGPVTVEEVDVPTPGPREVLVKLAAASLCSTELSVIDGMFGTGLFPVILGHEAVSLVEQLGPGSERYGLKVGQLVGAPPYSNMCLECHDCKNYGPDYCASRKVKGITAPGYFAEYAVVDAASAVIIADDESDLNVRNLSPIFCAGVTVWDALERGQIDPGQAVAIVGLGGLGQLAVQYATALGAKVFALDIQEEQLDVLKDTVHATINMKDLSPQQIVAKLKELNKGRGVEVAIVTAGSTHAYQAALPLLQPLGRLVVVGLPKEPISIPAGLLSAVCTKVVGARIPGQAAAQRCLDFSLRNHILPAVNQRQFRLEDLNEMIALMREGKVADGRMVIRF